MEIKDNFLNQEDFIELQTFMMGSECSWFFNPYIVEDINPKNKEFQFTHTFYIKDFPHSPKVDRMFSLMNTINPVSIFRIKANLRTRSDGEFLKSAFHIDMGDLEKNSPEKLKQWTTGIFYINTNNGYTEFEDGTKVESIANRLLSFPADVRHRGTSCSDEQTRVVINLNYFK